jgi:hypothetical protein
MKIYLGFTVAGNRSSVEAAKRILAAVQENAWEADRRVSPQEVFARDMKWLAECDLFIAEVSGSSFGLGFETGYLLGATAKKTILFYERGAEHRISLLITGNTHPNCILVPYSRLDELETLVRTWVLPPESASPTGCT